MDKEIMGSMLTAVQEFVKDSLKDKKVTSSLKVLEYGDHKIAIEKGIHTFLAAFVTGNVTKELREKMQEGISTIETQKMNVLEDWDGSKDSLGNVDLALEEIIAK
jgi:hypothetical protein